MLTGWIRNLVLAAALAAMPFQGIAAVLTVVLCHGEAQAHVLHAAQASGHGESHDHGAPGAVSGHEHGTSQQDDSGSPASALVHLCCNLSASAPPPIAVTAALTVFSVQDLVRDFPHPLFVPEQPQRPPLA